jgi:hypothetical protein
MTMTIEEQRKAIIEVASRREFEAWLKDTGRGWSEIAFAAWQIARNQSNNVPVALNEEKVFEYCLDAGMTTTEADNFAYKTGWRTLFRLIASPQQSNALEMAAKLKEALQLFLDAVTYNAEGYITGYDAWKYDRAVKLGKVTINNLIPQPESEGK